MIIRIGIGKHGAVSVGKLIDINCPNGHDGIGDITLVPAHGIFTGDTVLITKGRVSFHFGNISEISTRSNHDESEEGWKVHWKVSKPFTYEQYFEAARILRGLATVSPWK